MPALNPVLSIIPPARGVLEIGCRTGDTLAALRPTIGEGMDVSPISIRQARRAYPGLTFTCFDLATMIDRLAGNTYDYLLISSFPGEDLPAFLKAVYGACSPRLRLVLADGRARDGRLDSQLEDAGFEIVRRKPGGLPLVARPIRPSGVDPDRVSVSVVIPACNEAGNLPGMIRRIPEIGAGTEILIVEGNSSDETYEAARREIEGNPERTCRLLQQFGKGKWDAVKCGLSQASGEIIAILDSDLTVDPKELPRFVDLLLTNQGELINGERVFDWRQHGIMSPIKVIGNRLIAAALSRWTGQRMRDTLCGTKVFWKQDYERFQQDIDGCLREDPFGDFQLLFGAARENLKITSLPVTYRSRSYGRSKTRLWSHGWLLLRILFSQRMKY